MKFSWVPFKPQIVRLLKIVLPKEMVVPILQSRLKGKKWLIGSGDVVYALGSFEYETVKLFACMQYLGRVTMHKKIVVYFHQRPGHRAIQKDTVKYAPKNITALSPIKETTNWITVHQRKQTSLISILKNVFRYNILPYLPLLNLRKIPKIHKDADFVYTWNCIPLNSKKPFVIELENAYAVTFYHSTAFKFYKPIIKRIFLSKKCHKIVCMSKACKLSLINELGKGIEKKVVVLPPHIKSHLNENTGGKNTINFVFVGMDFELKGGRELLKAFHELKEPKARLSIVGFRNEKYVNMYKGDKRIEFLGKVAREKIFKEIYPKSDILVFPSLYESYGVAALEALSFGLGIISTNVYAFPEIVIDNYNGALLKHPFLKPLCYRKHCFVDVTKMTIPQFEKKYLAKTEFCRDLYLQIKNALEKATKNYKEWKENSKDLYISRFREEKWQETFQRIFE